MSEREVLRWAGLTPDEAAVVGHVPVLDEHGLLRVADAWIALSPVEEAVCRPLLAAFGNVVGRSQLDAAARSDHDSSPRALDTKVHRLRRRVTPLGLTVQTIRARGFALTWTTGSRQEVVSRS